MPNNATIIKNGSIQTSSLTHGLLNPEQDRKFIQQTFEATNLGPLLRHTMRTAKTGEIDKIGIASRILRAKTENTDDGYRANVNTDVIKYATTAVRLPWEITEETLRENIEGEQFEKIVTDLMTAQLGVDLEDLYLNGDESIPKQYNAGTAEEPNMKDTPDYNFLKINDGFIKQLKAGSHVVDYSSKNGLDLDLFYKMVRAIPNKYNNGKLRWLMSPHMKQEWERYLLEKAISSSGHKEQSVYNNPAAIPAIEVAAMGDDNLILTDPKNLCVVNTYGTKIRKTMEGKEAIMMDKRFYVIHLDFDTVIEELDAAAIATGIKF